MLLDAIMGIVGGAESLASQNTYAKQLEDISNNLGVSEAVKRGAGMMEEQANQGLAGYNQLMENADEEIPTTLNQVKNYFTSGKALTALSMMTDKVNKEKQGVNIANQQAIQANKQNYSNYLGNVLGPAEQHVMDEQTQLAINAAYEKMLGKQSDLSMVNSGVGSIENDATKLLSAPGMAPYISSLLSPSGALSPNQAVGAYKFSVPQQANLDFDN